MVAVGYAYGCVGAFRVEGRDDSTACSARSDTSTGTAEAVATRLRAISTIFGVLAFFRGCFRSLGLCRGAFGQLLAFGSHSLLDVTTLSSATTCPVLLPCDPVTAL